MNWAKKQASSIWADHKTESVLGILGVCGGIGLIIFSHPAFLSPSDTIQSITLILLVVVTISYAKSTHKTYKATSEQVSATREAVRVAVDSERNSFAPIVLLTLQSYGTSGIDAQYENIGRGPALNLSIWLENPQDGFFDYLENRSKKHNAIVKMGQTVRLNWGAFGEQQPLPEYNTGFSIVAEYTDIYRRPFKSEFAIGSLKESFHYGLVEGA